MSVRSENALGSRIQATVISGDIRSRVNLRLGASFAGVGVGVAVMFEEGVIDFR